jgi:hypothetical protein
MFKNPKYSPWGEIDWCDDLCPGVFMVAATLGGGIMVANDIAAFLSPAARKYCIRAYGFLCFGEKGEENIVLRELLDKKLWTVPDRIKNKAAFEEQINHAVQADAPEYWRARRQGLEAVQTRHTAPVRSYGAELS